MRMKVRSMRSAVQEPVAGVAGLVALSWTHETWNALDRCSTGQGGGQPGVQREGVGNSTHVGVNWSRATEGKHGGVVKLHGARVHFFLPAPLGSAVLKPDLEQKYKYCLTHRFEALIL